MKIKTYTHSTAAQSLCTCNYTIYCVSLSQCALVNPNDNFAINPFAGDSSPTMVKRENPICRMP